MSGKMLASVSMPSTTLPIRSLVRRDFRCGVLVFLGKLVLAREFLAFFEHVALEIGQRGELAFIFSAVLRNASALSPAWASCHALSTATIF